jgi:lipopolysaccharide biosynthesis glycosyltransferase
LAAHATNAIDVFVIDIGLSRYSARKLQKWTSTSEINIELINLNDYKTLCLDFFQFKKIKNVKYYYRLLAPYLFPTAERILYLDSDIMCLRDFFELFPIDLNGNVIAACQDKGFPFFQSRLKNSNFCVVNNFQSLSLSGDAPYFNSGVMLMDCELWKKNEITRRAIDISNENAKSIFLYDQYGLNIALYQRWLGLDPRWNYIGDDFDSNIIFRHFAKIKPNDLRYTGRDKELFF